MIESQLFLAFVVATTTLMLLPGPNVALIVSNSVAYGTRYGLLTVAGTSSAMVLQLSLTAGGLTALLVTLASWMEWVRWAGVVYLIVLGIRQWRAPPMALSDVRAQQKSVRRIVGRGMLVSLTNPKTLLFYSAFFPQFLSPTLPPGRQIAILSATFLAVAILLDSCWALLAGRARPFLRARGTLQNRLSGGLLIAAGVGLGLARKRS